MRKQDSRLYSRQTRGSSCRFKTQLFNTIDCKKTVYLTPLRRPLSVFSIIRLCANCRADIESLFQQNHLVLNWGWRLTQVGLRNDHKTVE